MEFETYLMLIEKVDVTTMILFILKPQAQNHLVDLPITELNFTFWLELDIGTRFYLSLSMSKHGVLPFLCIVIYFINM